MAIQGKFTDLTGTTHSKAYGKITIINADYLNKKGFFVLSVYHNKTSRELKRLPVFENKYFLEKEPDFETEEGVIKGKDNFSPYFYSNNVLKSFYDYLKTIPQFKDWQDV